MLGRPELKLNRCALVHRIGWTAWWLKRFRQRSRHGTDRAKLARHARKWWEWGMRCVGCGLAAVSERPERTASIYRRFRCRTCGKQFNERSAGLLNRTQFPSDVIALVVLWRLRCGAGSWTRPI